MSYQTKSFRNEPEISNPGILYRGIDKPKGEPIIPIGVDRYHKGEYTNYLQVSFGEQRHRHTQQSSL